MVAGSEAVRVTVWGDVYVPPAGEAPTAAAAVSTVQVRLSGPWSMLPAASTARAAKVCGPSDRPVRLTGGVHGAKAAPSSEHWKVAPASDEMAIVAALLLTVPVGAASTV